LKNQKRLEKEGGKKSSSEHTQSRPSEKEKGSAFSSYVEKEKSPSWDKEGGNNASKPTV